MKDRLRREGTRSRALYPAVHTNNNNNNSSSTQPEYMCAVSPSSARHRFQPVRAISGSLPSSEGAAAPRGSGVTAL
jgi:hypothetical protein